MACVTVTVVVVVADVKSALSVGANVTFSTWPLPTFKTVPAAVVYVNVPAH